MKYSLDDAVAKIAEKKDEIIYRRKRRNIGLLAVLTTLTVVALAAVLYENVSFEAIDGGYSAFGSFMLPEEAGGYIVVGVICFIAAVALTLLCMRWRKKDTEDQKKQENH